MFEVGPNSCHVWFQGNISEVRDWLLIILRRWSQIEGVQRKCRGSDIYKELPAYFERLDYVG